MAHSVFADAAEIEGVVVFDGVGDLGVAVGGAVLEVFDDLALEIQAEDEGVALRRWLEEFGKASDYLSHGRVRKHSIEKRLAWSYKREPETITAVR